MCDKQFFTFCSLWLLPFDLRFAPPVTHVQGHVSSKYEVIMAFASKL